MEKAEGRLCERVICAAARARLGVAHAESNLGTRLGHLGEVLVSLCALQWWSNPPPVIVPKSLECDSVSVVSLAKTSTRL